MTTLSIIGTAGRDKTKQMTCEHFNFMCSKVASFIKEHNLDNNSLTLVSGGAAWADHVAVDTFLNNSDLYKLILYLPCAIEMKNGYYQFVDTGTSDWRVNPGRSSNNYHNTFKRVLGRDTIKEIMSAKDKGAVIDTSSNGFHDRNTKVSKSDYILAFTFSKGDKPEDGGTRDTWNKSKSQKYHYSLLHIPTITLSSTSKSKSSSSSSKLPLSSTDNLKREREENDENDSTTVIEKIINNDIDDITSIKSTFTTTNTSKDSSSSSAVDKVKRKKTDTQSKITDFFTNK